MVKELKLLLAILVGFILIVNVNSQSTAQEKGWCYTDQMMEKMYKENPSLIEQRNQAEAYVKKYVATHQHSNKKNDKSINFIIPVVFHVLTSNGLGYVSKAQIEAQLETLNQDFQRRNPDTSQTRSIFKPYAADMNVEFRLARIDPDGNCTEGIVRVESPLTLNANTNIGAVSHWGPSYLNVIVVEDIVLPGGVPGTTLGFATLPFGGTMHSNFRIVILRQEVERNTRTLTHEVGHSFGLLHTFNNGCSNSSGGGDGVADTPPSLRAHFNCPLSLGQSSYNTCPNVPSGDPYRIDAPDQIENYMSYNSCQNMFTHGQRDVINAYLNRTGNAGLAHLSSAANLVTTGTQDPYNTSPVCEPIANFTYNKTTICEGASVTFMDDSYNGDPTNFNWSFPGGTPSTASVADPVITYNTAGKYGVTHQPSNSGGSGMITTNNIITVYPLTARYSGLIMDGFESNTDFTNDWILDNPTGIRRFSRTANTAATGNASLVLLNTLNSTNGLETELVSPSYDLSSVENPTFKFKYAFARKNSSDRDRLFISYSTDCGESWVLLLPMTTGVLTTSGSLQAGFWSPTSNEWVERSINLSSITNETNVRFKFVFTSGGGNNFYLDDINIDGTLSVGDELNNVNSFNIYPNPSPEGVAVATINLAQNVKNLVITATDLLGKKVTNIVNQKPFAKGSYILNIDKNNELNTGVYFITFNADNNTTTKKLIIQ